MNRSTHTHVKPIRFCITLQGLILTILFASCNEDSGITKIKKLNYPSSSAIEYFNNQFFVMGDDARNLLVLDSDLMATASIALYTYTETRIPKPIKGDIEAITIINNNKLLLVGSGSLPPYRNGGWVIDPATGHVDSIRLDTLYQRFRNEGFEMLNIEGACTIPGFIILANRGNNAWRKNHLVLVNDTFWKDQSHVPFSLMELGVDSNSAVFNGVSGLAYTPETDELVIAISTENTSSNTGDGAIGKSYLWIVKGFSSKIKWKTIKPDRIIDLEKLDKRFTGLKIESVCVTGRTNNKLHLALVADNDDGNSTIVRIIVNTN